jgi:hypothetical protein
MDELLLEEEINPRSDGQTRPVYLGNRYCPDPEQLVEAQVNRVLTQYRESPKFLHMLRTYLRKSVEVLSSLCVLPEMFDLDVAVGDQLTLLGERLGWPRCHCTCVTQPVFGFNCKGFYSEYQMTGFCDASQTWLNCGPFSISEICIDDDELYRNFLRVRRYQMMSLYSIDSLTEAIQIFWGPTARVLDAGHGRVVITPGRHLEETELPFLQLYPRVLPIAPGIQVRFHFGVVGIFGFGTGWEGFCESEREGDAPIITEALTETAIWTENQVEIITGTIFGDSDWMCEIDVGPYECSNIR